MRICRHCLVRVEKIECADGHDRWMHKTTGVVDTIYLQCKLPPKTAQPIGSS